MRYVLFVLSVVGGFFLTQYVSNQFLVNVMTQCQGMLQIFAIVAGILILVLGLLSMLKEWFSMDDSLIGVIYTVAGGLIVTTILPIILVMTVGQIGSVRSVFCFDCKPPKKGAELVEKGDFEGARVLLENFLKDEQVRLSGMPANTPDALKEQAQGCVGDAEMQLAQAYFELAAAPIDSLNVLPTPRSNEEITSCNDKVAEAQALLDKSKKLAEVHAMKALLSAIDVQSKRLLEASKKCEPSVLVKPENVKMSRNGLAMIVRLSTSLGDQPIVDAVANIAVRSGNDLLDVNITEHKGDEQVCMLLLADSSGSVGKNGLAQFRGAVDKLNSYHKPSDYYGLMPFAGEGTNDLVDMTSIELIDTDELNIDGKNTFIWDAVDSGIKSMDSCKQSINRRTLILLTDGKDTGSAYMADATDEVAKAQSLHDLATKKNVDICVIGVTSGSQEDENSAKALSTLSTGCGFHYVEDFEGIAAEFENIFGVTGHYYSVSLPSINGSEKNDIKVCHTTSDTCVKVDMPEANK
jgi:hypothetical protein